MGQRSKNKCIEVDDEVQLFVLCNLVAIKAFRKSDSGVVFNVPSFILIFLIFFISSHINNFAAYFFTSFYCPSNIRTSSVKLSSKFLARSIDFVFFCIFFFFTNWRFDYYTIIFMFHTCQISPEEKKWNDMLLFDKNLL